MAKSEKGTRCRTTRSTGTSTSTIRHHRSHHHTTTSFESKEIYNTDTRIVLRMTMMKLLIVSALTLWQVSAWTSIGQPAQQQQHQQQQQSHVARLQPYQQRPSWTKATTTTGRLPAQERQSSTALFMGRAAAVRANTKAKTDGKKSKINGMFGKRIIMAVKLGGSPDPNANRSLADVIKQAKLNNVPVENISRAIKRASEASVGDFTESTFEAYGFGGASFVINVLTDNGNRATSDVKSTVNRRNAKMAEMGSVIFLYDRRGKVEVAAPVNEEALMDAAIEAGVDDFEMLPGDADDTTIVYTDPKEAGTMAETIKGMGLEDKVKFSLAWVSKAPVECNDEDFEKNMNIIEALEELDDVDSVEHNMSN